MAATVELIDPRKVQKNPDNPRLIFQSQELNALEESIREQGILVPLTVFKDGRNFTLLAESVAGGARYDWVFTVYR
jgi:ParB-like chromosome segregation protein Spo0J